MLSRSIRFLHRPAAVLLRNLSSDSPLCSLHFPLPGIALVQLNKPESKNALSRAMLDQLSSALSSVRREQSLRAAVIWGGANCFCAGADLVERRSMDDAQVAEFVRQLRSTFTEVEDLPVPVIAAIDGAALGGGLELALACDLRVAGASAVMGLTETSLAIIPGAGGTQRLPRAIGLPRAKHLVFTAKRLNAEEAERIGLIQAVASSGKTAYDEAMVIAASIAKNGPIALRMAKQAMNRGMQVDVATGMAIEQLCYAGVIKTEDRLEGLQAFKEKRAPVYRGK